MADFDVLRRVATDLDRLGLKQSAARIRAAIEVAPDERVAPVQDNRRGATVKLSGIPWGLHEMLWRVYADHGHGDQSAERLAERGGFGRGELGMLAVGAYGSVDSAARGRTVPLLDLYRDARANTTQEG
jgi:hypothetical protein